MFGCGYCVSNQVNYVLKGMQFHNSYLSFLIECGIWGTVMLGTGFVCFICTVLQSIKRCLINLSFQPFVFVCLIIFDIALTAYGESFLFAVGSTEGFAFWFLIAWALAFIKQFMIR